MITRSAALQGSSIAPKSTASSENSKVRDANDQIDTSTKEDSDVCRPSALKSRKKKRQHEILDQDGRSIKKTRLENESCRDLVCAFSGKMELWKLPTASEILHCIAHVIPSTEKDVYFSWISADHVSSTIEDAISSEAYYFQHKVPNFDHYQRAVNKRREHDLGRNHTAPAIFWMLMTSLLMEHAHSDMLILTEASFSAFESEFPILVEKSRRYLRANNFHLQLHKAYRFLLVLFRFIPVNGFLEVCLLIVSCLEGRGKHHQRSGSNRSFPCRAYRYLIEKVGQKVDIGRDLLFEFEKI